MFGSSRGSSGPGLVFENYGTVKGSLKFGNGDDSLLFGPGSKISGNVDGGGGTNDLTLDANFGESATLGGSVLNFSSITKIGEGSWAILGGVPSVPGRSARPVSLAHHRLAERGELPGRPERLAGSGGSQS